MKMPLKRFWAGVLLAMLPLMTLQAEDYAIRLEPPAKKGDKFQVVGKLNDVNKLQLLVDGKVVKEDAGSEVWEIDAKVEVLEADARELATKLKIDIKKLKLSRKGMSKDVFVAGTVVMAGLVDGAKTYTVEGEDVEPAVAKALQELVTLNDAKEPTDDVVFGTKERKKVGDTWPLDTEAARKALTQKNVEVATEDVTGGSKLEEIVTVDGQKCLKVTGHVDIKKMVPKLPPGLKLNASTVEVKTSGIYAVSNNHRMAATLNYKMDMKASGPGPDGKEIEMRVSGEMQGEKTFKYQ